MEMMDIMSDMMDRSDIYAPKRSSSSSPTPNNVVVPQTPAWNRWTPDTSLLATHPLVAPSCLCSPSSFFANFYKDVAGRAWE